MHFIQWHSTSLRQLSSSIHTPSIPLVLIVRLCSHEIPFVQVDVDKNTEATEKYEVEAMPTFKLIKGGTVVTTVMGADEAAIEAALNQHK